MIPAIRGRGASFLRHAFSLCEGLVKAKRTPAAAPVAEQESSQGAAAARVLSPRIHAWAPPIVGACIVREANARDGARAAPTRGGLPTSAEWPRAGGCTQC